MEYISKKHKFDSKTCFKFFQEHEYLLYAVINHTGSRFSGHYTAVIRSFTENKWYRFDDSHVTVVMCYYLIFNV